MLKKCYSKFDEDEFSLRDYLAIDRTILANERTFLAYLRTALTVFISGVTFIKFFDVIIIEIIGWIFVPLAIIIAVIGIHRYRKFERQVEEVSGPPFES